MLMKDGGLLLEIETVIAEKKMKEPKTKNDKRGDLTIANLKRISKRR